MDTSAEPSAIPEVPGPDSTEFRDAMARLPTAVSIVTTCDEEGRDHGFTAGSVASVSIDPPLVLVCLARNADCHPAFASSSRWAVSVTSYEHTGLARRFATKGADKFAEGRFRRTDSGVLVLEGARLALECQVLDRYPGGDHDILVGRVVRTHTDSGDALVFVDRSFTTTAALAPR
ncbi:flavin reductase family protein [Nocardiopsis halotolerans]|uniref:flavin reductase family protein n=1 Tax=Nocardiopsis halotolerans TaxID=124252 RepID=UPI000348B7AA|nr:flavin reductase family protein [Nocardiopsis halotolerans]